MSFQSRDLVKKLIGEYEKYPSLYDVQHPNYKNKTIRHECIGKIAKVLLPYGQLSVDDIKKKINGLRTQYFNEISKQKKSQTSGTGTADVYNTNWWCFELLCFLKNSAPVRKGESNLKASTSQQNNTDMETVECSMELLYDGPTEEVKNIEFRDPPSPSNYDNVSSPSMSYSDRIEPPRKKRKINDSTAQEVLRKACEALGQTGQEEDHFHVFGQLIASELRQIKNARSVNNIKRSIMNLIYDALDGEGEDQ